MVSESVLESTEHGLVPTGKGWFVVNAREDVILGVGDSPCLQVAVGARERSTGPDWGAYTVDEAALRHGAGVERETTDAQEAYARFPTRERTRYREGRIP
jgi:hypothetical protein